MQYFVLGTKAPSRIPFINPRATRGYKVCHNDYEVASDSMSPSHTHPGVRSTRHFLARNYDNPHVIEDAFVSPQHEVTLC